MVGRGKISSYAGDKARVTVPERDGAVTAPLTVAGGALTYTLVNGALTKTPPAIGAQVAFIEFDDGEGAIIAVLEA